MVTRTIDRTVLLVLTRFAGASPRMTIGGLAAAAAPELFQAFAKSRPAAQQLWQRADAVLGGGAGHDLRCADRRQRRRAIYHCAQPAGTAAGSTTAIAGRI